MEAFIWSFKTSFKSPKSLDKAIWGFFEWSSLNHHLALWVWIHSGSWSVESTLHRCQHWQRQSESMTSRTRAVAIEVWRVAMRQSSYLHWHPTHIATKLGSQVLGFRVWVHELGLERLVLWRNCGQYDDPAEQGQSQTETVDDHGLWTALVYVFHCL